ncbi:uncharacterized protein Z519_11272 [Cladophialophora bantiana CBS 173.52]|uniref:DUF6604 domain-containing protein n=1 Tax=Cladophialophora bantiana (strain ATCC 10958 / CBS 173.52 / CDC B-1940 / NIH 8579) TaxID=1442370 RepID=A0A0D2EDG7_CLAB1|nr:uncharacterized protein Z519_11272 [Cladophialophora bantiana CBS 173.52]KIW88161.1 hypothetical protein Z519_11272 [Cladophialophora bantiana CBS 173.52]
MSILNPEYGKLYGQYKQATDNVLSWIRALYNRPSTIPLNNHLQLAVSAIQDGIEIPEDILEDLRTAIDLRTKTAKFHMQSGTSDHGHDHIITILQTISWIFSPSRPSTPESTLTSSALPLPAPSQQEYFTPQAPDPPLQGYLPPFPLQQERCHPPFCAFDHISQYEQRPSGAFYSPPPSPPPPPGLYPTWSVSPSQYSPIDLAIIMSIPSFHMPASMFERAPRY